MLAMDVARDESELFVVTENGYGKRTSVSEYPVKGRGTKGVLTAKLTEKKGGLAGALIVREHQDLLFISQNGMVQRTQAGGISQMGRATQGVKVMNIRDDDRLVAVALVVESGGAINGSADDPALEAPEPGAARPSRTYAASRYGSQAMGTVGLAMRMKIVGPGAFGRLRGCIAASRGRRSPFFRLHGAQEATMFSQTD